MKIKTILTHAGSFHSDELMAIALLEKYYFMMPTVMGKSEKSDYYIECIKNDVQIVEDGFYYSDGVKDCRTLPVVIRSRDARLLKEANKSQNVFVIDVGSEFNENLLNFDHHQKSMNNSWPDGTPYSSTGLVWRYLEKNGYLNELSQEIKNDLVDKLIKPLDKHDNGIETFQLALQIAPYNRSSEDPDIQYKQFNKAKNVISEYFDNLLFNLEMKYEAKKVINNCWNKAVKNNSKCVLLNQYIQYHDCGGLLKEVSNNEAQMLVIRGQGNRFSVESISDDAVFSSKYPCPKEWRGRTDFNVSINNKNILIKFAHKAGFKTIVEGSPSDALTVANYIVENHLNFKKNNKERNDKMIGGEHINFENRNKRNLSENVKNTSNELETTTNTRKILKLKR